MKTEMGDLVGAGSSAAGRGGAPAGAVVVPIEAAAAAAPAAPPARAGARVSARVTRSGAAPPPPPAGGPAAGALPAAAARAPPPPPASAWTRLSARLALAAALFLLGCAAAGLALFAMVLPPAAFRLLGKASCAPPTDAEVASLRTASEYLLLAASTQMLAATMVLLVPVWQVAALGHLLGIHTSYLATVVLAMLVSCHGSVHGALAFHFWLFFAVLCAALVVGSIVSIR